MIVKTAAITGGVDARADTHGSCTHARVILQRCGLADGTRGKCGVVASVLKGTQTGHTSLPILWGCRRVWLRGSST